MLSILKTLRKTPGYPYASAETVLFAISSDPNIFSCEEVSSQDPVMIFLLQTREIFLLFQRKMEFIKKYDQEKQKREEEVRFLSQHFQLLFFALHVGIHISQKENNIFLRLERIWNSPHRDEGNDILLGEDFEKVRVQYQAIFVALGEKIICIKKIREEIEANIGDGKEIRGGFSGSGGDLDNISATLIARIIRTMDSYQNEIQYRKYENSYGFILACTKASFFSQALSQIFIGVQAGMLLRE